MEMALRQRDDDDDDDDDKSRQENWPSGHDERAADGLITDERAADGLVTDERAADGLLLDLIADVFSLKKIQH